MNFEFKENFLLAFANFGSGIVSQWKLSLTFHSDIGNLCLEHFLSIVHCTLSLREMRNSGEIEMTFVWLAEFVKSLASCCVCSLMRVHAGGL
jgi:hypothetical protein